jgi:hypothetical protein
MFSAAGAFKSILICVVGRREMLGDALLMSAMCVLEKERRGPREALFLSDLERDFRSLYNVDGRRDEVI